MFAEAFADVRTEQATAWDLLMYRLMTGSVMDIKKRGTGILLSTMGFHRFTSPACL